MEFTPEQITEIISEITRGEQGLQGLLKQGSESLMLSERSIHNASSQDVSNGYRDRRVYHGSKVFELRIPRSHNINFPMLWGVLKEQEEEAQKLVSSLYCSGLTTEQVGKIYEQFYDKHYSKSQVSRLLHTAREDVNAWLERKLDKRFFRIEIVLLKINRFAKMKKQRTFRNTIGFQIDPKVSVMFQ